MTRIPTIVCPIDFSEGSRAALRYAAAIADHFGASLVALTVDDPLLAAAASHIGVSTTLNHESELELRRFCTEALGDAAGAPKTLHFRVATGKPAAEILRAAEESTAGLIVISSRGRGGFRKLFFGSTTERVLRETAVPVLVTPGDDFTCTSLRKLPVMSRVIAPVDLSSASRPQVEVAAGIAGALSLPLIVAHVVEPVLVPSALRSVLPGADAVRRTDAEEALAALSDVIPRIVRTESLLLTGGPAEEIVKLTHARGSNLVVMGLHSGGPLGPRVGSVTYRVLCLTRTLVLALPPRDSANERRPARQAEWAALQER
jgi:universal stress protein A